VNRETSKKDRRQKAHGVNKKMDRAVDKRAPGKVGETHGIEADGGLSPNLQAHIGRHVRAVFDEVAREPIPEHLLRLLNDLERSGDK
jgi:anti-sigma factor NepR-like protein